MTETSQGVSVTHPELPQAEVERGNKFVALANAMVITEDTFQVGVDRATWFTAEAKRLDGFRRSIVDPINASVKRVNDFFRQPIQDRENAALIVKGKLTAFRAEQDRIALEVQQRHEAEQREARAKAEAEERAALERAEAEAKRRQDEEDTARAKAEAAAAEYRAAQLRGDEEEAMRQAVEREHQEEQERASRGAADEARRKGEEEARRAQEAAMAAAAVPAPVVERTESKGAADRVTWHWRPVNFVQFVKAVAAGDAPFAWLTWDDKALREAARSIKDTKKFEGVEFYPRKDIVLRGKR